MATSDPVEAFNLRLPLLVSIVLSSVTAICRLPADKSVVVVAPPTKRSPPVVVIPPFFANVVIPAQLNVPVRSRLLKLATPPTYKSLSIPTPPSTIIAPELLLVDCVVFNTLSLPDKERVSLTLTSLLNVTGPSNWDRISPESPPSTIILSLIVASSKMALSLAGSSPVTVGIGVSNDVSSPVADDFLVLPI